MTALMKLRRASETDCAPGVVAPPEDRRAAVWQRPVPGVGRAPLVWLLGVHGGAGTSTLVQVLAPAGDANRRWPGAFDGESPFVLLVARETIAGLTHAHDLLRQHRAGLAGRCEVLGLVTVAARPGRIPAEIRRYRQVVGSLAGCVWQLPWYEDWTLVEVEHLPVWSPADPPPQQGKRKIDPLRSIPREVDALGAGIVAHIRERLSASSYSDQRDVP